MTLIATIFLDGNVNRGNSTRMNALKLSIRYRLASPKKGKLQNIILCYLNWFIRKFLYVQLPRWIVSFKGWKNTHLSNVASIHSHPECHPKFISWFQRIITVFFILGLFVTNVQWMLEAEWNNYELLILFRMELLGFVWTCSRYNLQTCKAGCLVCHPHVKTIINCRWCFCQAH